MATVPSLTVVGGETEVDVVATATGSKKIKNNT